MILRSKASLLYSIAVAVVFAPAWCGAQSFTISTIAGTSAGYSGDGSATAAELNHPNRVALDTAGNLYIADSENNVVRKVSTTGTISTVAGNGTAGYTGDGGAATSAELNGPVDVAVDSAGNLYICDNGNDVIRKVAAGSGTITTYAGNSQSTTYGTGGPGPATSVALGNPAGIAVDAAGNLYIAEPLISLVRVVPPSGTISLFAGGMGNGFSGDGGPATQAAFNNVRSVSVDAAGNVYVCDCGNGRIRKIATNGIITTVAGNGNTSASSGDGGPATSAGMSPEDAAVDASGNLYIVDDTFLDLIREVAPSGTINTIAGGANCSVITGPALNACLNEPYGIAVHGSNIYIADTADSLIRLLTPSGSTGGGGPAPTILSGGVVPLYSTSSTIQPGEWVSIYGNNLITGTTPVNWTGNYPTTLGGTSVMIDNNLAYLSYASPTLINLQAPNDTSTGTVNVTVTDANGSATTTVTLAAQSPSFRPALRCQACRGNHSSLERVGAYGNGTYDVLGPTGTSLGYPTVAAKAGDSVVLFGTGFGPTNPAVPAGQPFSGVATAIDPVNLTINGQVVTPSFVGISEPGQFQFNLTIPSGLGTGDQPLLATLNSMSTQANVLIALQ